MQHAPVVQVLPQLSMHSVCWHPPPSGTQAPASSVMPQRSPVHEFPQLSWQFMPQKPSTGEQQAPVLQATMQLSRHPVAGRHPPPSATHPTPASTPQAPPAHVFPQLSLQSTPQEPFGVQQALLVQRLPPQLSMHSPGAHAPPSGTHGPESLPASATHAPCPGVQAFPQLSRQLVPQVVGSSAQHAPVKQGLPQVSEQVP
jgi:hypothetical protein